MKIRHPAFPEVVKDVTAYAAWRDAGWVVLDGTEEPETEPARAPDQTAEDEEAAKPTRPRKTRRR